MTQSQSSIKRSHAQVEIRGMTCAACVRRVEKAVGQAEGVSRASVNLATEKLTVDYDPRAITLDQLSRL
ncbi:MAG: heavy metal-associated domain-containing protein, partial [Eubacteriales bacterium]|nr:heavy metal-associated domain-containing protein [Eubacteriales bacterium]